MSSRLKLAGICFAAAFALAACGGGGGTTAVMPDPGPMEPPPPAGPTAESIKADAADAITDAAVARMAGEQAEKDALKYAGMLTAESVKGDSAMAIANAEKILAAEMAANQAVMDADDALNDAMAAKTAAEGLPADDAGRAGAIAAAERAIEEATADKNAAQAILDKNPMTDDDPPVVTPAVDSLKEAVAAVKGSNRLAEGYPMMPAAIGKRIAGEVMTALTASATAGITTSGTLGADTPRDGIKNDAADIGAMTWAMIVGEDNVMMKRLGTIDSSGALTVGNAEVPVASLAGMTATDVTSTTLTDGTIDADGGTTPGSYMGIVGAVICLGGTDGCKVTDGKLGAGWYFSPALPKELYVPNPDMAGMYMVATMYATYGYWLTYTDGAASGVTLYSASTANQADLNLGQAGTGDDAKDVTARYSGSAVGISKRGDNSGQFTAAVNLTAKFAVVPTLRGHISSFQGGAVGNWTVVLNEANLDTTSAGFTNGTTAGGGAPGAWTAQGYGPTPVDHDGEPGTTAQNQRPTGFFGRFNANFGDGSAAGAYTTRAD